MKTNKLLIIDLESTCWEDKPDEYAEQNSEIIEIGLTLYSRTLNKILSNETHLIKPEQSTISTYCTELTTITSKMVQDGLRLSEALSQIEEKYKLKNLLWGSWGYYDNKQLKRETKRKSIKNPFSDRNFLNIKTHVALQQGWAKEKGIKNALNALEMTFEGTQHRAIDDTFNIANILQKLNS